METLRIIDTGQTRESLRVGDGETYRVVCAAEHYNGNRDCPPTRTDRDRAGHIITPILPGSTLDAIPCCTSLYVQQAEPSSSASTCRSRATRAAALPAGQNRLESCHGKTPPAPLHERAPRRPNRRSDALNRPPPKLKPGRGVASTTAEGTRHRSAGIKNGSLPKKSGVRPKLLDSAGTA